MSLIPYQPHEGREIVLRHHNAIVVRDSHSHRLEIRGVSECPTCHQPLTSRPPPAERPFDRAHGSRHDTYVDPDYFRMLRAVNTDSTPDGSPPSPIRRVIKPALVEPTSPSSQASPPPNEPSGSNTGFASGESSVPPHPAGKIRRDAFSPGYFNTFFVEERILGKGGKGVVLLVRHEIDGCPLGQFACKRVPVGDDHVWLEKVLVEVELLAKLSHPNLVSYRHVWLEDVQLSRFGPSVACAFILQQYCNGGDLHQYIVGGTPREATKEDLKAQMRRRSKGQLDPPTDLFSGVRQLSFEEIYTLFKDIASGVAYLHAANYVHRDLKPNNCLLHREGGRLICLISDFGEVQPKNAMRNSTGATGTISYCAPEVLRFNTATNTYENFTTKSDIFSLGMILYFMCFGRLPYRSANALQEELEDVDELRAEIIDWQGFQDERRLRPDLPPKLYTLLKRLLSLNPSERPSANEVLKAMRGESPPSEASARDEHSPVPSIGLNGNRIQNLDSPAIPSSPIPAPRQRQSPGVPDKLQAIEQWPRSPRRESSPNIGGSGSRQEQNPPGAMRHRASQSHSMVLSRSQDGFRNSTGPGDSSPNGPRGTRTRSGSFSPPLLMAPPSPPPNILVNHLSAIYDRVMAYIGPRVIVLSYALRLAFFVGKVYSLSQPCLPYIANPQVGIPLIAVAALDLGLPQLASSDGPGYPNPYSPTRRAWGLGTSFLLLILHFVAIWVASSQSALCVANHHEILDAWPPQASAEWE
ncbi:kinase-like domain-containing protein [Mariannaea sp. PMI_226]|nr:kinase-like domain-containing protein [Mariannaea sp. PMI_226]